MVFQEPTLDNKITYKIMCSNFNALKSTIVSPNVKSRDEEEHPIENILPGVYNSIFQKKYE